MTCMRRYTFKLYPTKEQASALHEQRMMMADLWNALLQRREDVYRRERRSLTRFDLEYEITALYREMPEWRALSTWTARRVNKSLDDAFAAFFRRAKQGAGAQAGYPRYKRRKDSSRIPHRCASGCKLTQRGGRNWSLHLKGFDGLIHARGALPDDAIVWKDADVIYRDGTWWFSVCVEMEARRRGGKASITVRLGVLDGFAKIDGQIETLSDLTRVQALQGQIDYLKSERDQRWPTRAPQDSDWHDANAEISRLSARAARIRANTLHVWSARLVGRSADLTVFKPAMKEHIASPRGDAREWGANVETVSKLNRSILSHAPAMAAAMLEYKAQEAGIRCDVITDEAPDIAIGEKLVAAGKTIRKVKRAIRRMSDEHHLERIGGP